MDVRIISATNADLKSEVEQSRFREDLLFRLNTIEIHLPPLRERPEDIPVLARHFLSQHCQRYRRNVRGIAESAIQALLSHPWPGNIRELSHVMERAVLMTSTPDITLADLGLHQVRNAQERRLEDMSLEEVEQLLIRKTMSRFEGNASKAAESLGLSRSAFYRRLQRYGL